MKRKRKRGSRSLGGQQPMRKALRPLALIEKEVAVQNLWLVESFLRRNQLPFDDWFDVVIFRYLRAVELWFDRPDLYRYEFSTIAWNNMRSAVGHERQKQKRRIQTVSLDEPIPGTDGLTYADIVTEENLNYIPYKEVAL